MSNTTNNNNNLNNNDGVPILHTAILTPLLHCLPLSSLLLFTQTCKFLYNQPLLELEIQLRFPSFWFLWNLYEKVYIFLVN